MTCRIHYVQNDRGELRSGELTTDKGVSYYAVISYSEGYWKVMNAKRRNVVREGKSKNRNVLRRAVRRELIKLGVKLEKEFSCKGYAKTGR